MHTAVRVFKKRITTSNLVNVKEDNMSGIPMWLQRISALIILVCVSPIILFMMLLISSESKGGLFFKQTRVGRYGRRFTCFKLRSMFAKGDRRYHEPAIELSDRRGVCKKYVNDPRVTGVGKFIRKYSIDELPQLYNVVIGDMSLIGPRPSLVSEFQQYDSMVYPRLLCEAGLTGLWQVSGRANTTFEEQVTLDKQYMRNQSVWLDLSILLKTIPAVVLARGAY